MSLITFLFAIGCVLTLPQIALMSLQKDGATAKFNFDFLEMTIAAGLGSLVMWVSMIGSQLPNHIHFIMILMGSLLALGAWVDRVAAWAPDMIILPVCVAVFLISPEVDTPREFAIAVGSGIALYIAGIILWIPQEMTNYRFAPPADLIAIAAPFVLFGTSYETAVIFATVSILLIGALKSRIIAGVFSRPEAVEDGASDVVLGEKQAVTFLSVIFPVLLIALATVQMVRNGIIVL
jgi:hypothetical protein